jgi:protein-disulfide isomerase
MTEQNNLPPYDETESASNEVFIFKRSHVYTALLPLAFVVGIAIGYIFWGRPDSQTLRTANVPPDAGDPLPQPQPQPGEPQGLTRIDVSLDNDPSMGPEDAPITIVEFSDFACGYCRRFHQQTFQQLMDQFPDQIHFVYRDFPVVGGYEAALASECANEQGAFWAFHDLLFDGGLGLDSGAYSQYAEQLGLDVEALVQCVDEGRYATEVEGDAQYAASLGANATPWFFINGIPVIGAQPLSVFIEVINAELGN